MHRGTAFALRLIASFIHSVYAFIIHNTVTQVEHPYCFTSWVLDVLSP